MKIGAKVLAALCMTLLAATAFARGGQDAADDGPLTVRWLYPDNTSYPLQDDWLVLEEMQRVTGVTIDLIVAPDNSADFEAKRQIIFASGDIPEIISRTEAPPEEVIQGLILPISDYVGQMPNLSQFLDEYNYGPDMDNLREADGKYYTLPVKADTRRSHIHGYMVRIDLFEEHGIPIPETYADVLSAGQQLKALYPDADPVINRFGVGNILSLAGFAFDTAAGWALSSNGHIYDDETDSWVFAPATDGYRNLLVWTNEMLETGVLDEEWATLDSSAYEQIVTQGNTFILFDWIGNQVRYNVAGTTIDPDFNVQPIWPLVGPNGSYGLPRAPLYGLGMIFPMTLQDHPRFEEILQFIDWFYTEEAAIITTFGVEGETYEVVDGRLQFIDPTNDYSRTHGLLNNALNIRLHPDWFAAANGPVIDAQFREIAEQNIIKPPMPKVILNEEELEELQLLIPGVSDLISVATLEFAFGERSFDEWDAFVQEVRSRGADEIGEIINGAWDRQR